MRGWLLTTLLSLLGSLSLAVPVAQAVPSFSEDSIAPVVFYVSPGSTCSEQPPNTATLPTASGTGTITYTTSTLPSGVTFTRPSLTGNPATIAAQTATSYTYTATDDNNTPSDTTDDTTATLSFTLEIVDEKATLQRFYNATDGPNWTDKTGGWGNPITATCLDALPSVSLTAGRVTRLAFHTGNNLSGAIPALSALTELTHLYLNDNNFSSGPIPDLSALTKLTYLTLSNTNRSGAIPDLSVLPLRWLELQNNALTGNLDNLNSLNPWALYLHNNQLSGAIPPFPIADQHFRLSLYGNPDLYGYHTELNIRPLLRLLAPGTGAAVCLPSTEGGTDCTVPTKVDKLRVQVSPTQLVFTWAPHPATPAPSGYTAEYYPPGGPDWIDAWTGDPVTAADPATAATATSVTITGLTPGATYYFLVRTHDVLTAPRLYYFVTLPERAPPRPPSTGGGGGGSSASRDRHGDTPDDATALTPRRYTTGAFERRIDARLQSRRDVDYFHLALPHPGVLTAYTTGADTTGQVYQAQDEGAPLLITEDTDSGRGANFRLGTPVEEGTYYLAVAAGRSSGNYTLHVHYTPAIFENPPPASPQSGIGVLSGWVCAAEAVEIELNGVPQEAAYGTERLDTEPVCGDTDNGFGLLFNWNLLGAGEHEVVAFVDDVELGRATVTVTTLGAEFVREVAGECAVADFPTEGESVRLVWQQPQQNFVIAAGEEPRGENRAGTVGVGYLENPGPNAFQSGIGVISGWVCEADAVEIELGALGTQPAAYGTERLDTEPVCGDTDNGFGLLFNWNLLGEGDHEVIASVDGEELGRATVRVTTLGEEFLREVEGECMVEDFPNPGETVTLEWQQSQQNFVITALQ